MSEKARDKDFSRFHDALKRQLAAYGFPAPGTKGHNEFQKVQVERLAELEVALRDALVAHRWGKASYVRFVKHVCDDRRNILSARPYFRERQVVFAGPISDALKARDWRALQKFHPNYNFFEVAMSCRKWPLGSPVWRLFCQMKRHRKELVIANLPLAINRGHKFYNCAVKSRSSLSSMDIVDTFAEGLISGVDKYVGKWAPVWRSVAIGRMVGFGIDENSATILHFYPPDRRRIYRFNKARAASPDAPFEAVLEAVNAGAESAASPSELAELAAASSAPVSADAPLDEDGKRSLSDSFAAPEEWRPDVALEAKERAETARRAWLSLTPFERKVVSIRTGVLAL
jgi:hypothetical protein